MIIFGFKSDFIINISFLLEFHRDPVLVSTSWSQGYGGILACCFINQGIMWLAEIESGRRLIFPTPSAALKVALLTLQMYYFNQSTLSSRWKLDEIMGECDRELLVSSSSPPSFSSFSGFFWVSDETRSFLFLGLLFLFLSLCLLHSANILNGLSVACKVPNVLYFNAWLYTMVHMNKRNEPLHTIFTLENKCMQEKVISTHDWRVLG